MSGVRLGVGVVDFGRRSMGIGRCLVLAWALVVFVVVTLSTLSAILVIVMARVLIMQSADLLLLVRESFAPPRRVPRAARLAPPTENDPDLVMGGGLFGDMQTL